LYNIIQHATEVETIKRDELPTYVSQPAGIEPIVQQFNAKIRLTHFWEVDWRKHRHPTCQVVKHRRNICIYNDRPQGPDKQKYDV